jgi:hypothetical protein
MWGGTVSVILSYARARGSEGGHVFGRSEVVESPGLGSNHSWSSSDAWRLSPGIAVLPTGAVPTIITPHAWGIRVRSSPARSGHFGSPGATRMVALASSFLSTRGDTSEGDRVVSRIGLRVRCQAPLPEGYANAEKGENPPCVSSSRGGTDRPPVGTTDYRRCPMNAPGLNGFGRGHRWQNGGESHRQRRVVGDR